MKTKKKAPAPSRADRPSWEPSHAEVAARAYAIWEQAGHPQGQALAHWLQATAQLQQEHSAAGSAVVSCQPAAGVKPKTRATC